MKEKLQKFMMGRYGSDELSKALSAVTVVVLLISMLMRRGAVHTVLYAMGVALLVFNTYRMFSKDISKRYQENQKFLNMRHSAVAKKDAAKKRWDQRDSYRFYKCPECKQKVRVPKGRGKICITCPKCKHEFIKKS